MVPKHFDNHIPRTSGALVVHIIRLHEVRAVGTSEGLDFTGGKP
jgi:hypothetical protein